MLNCPECKGVGKIDPPDYRKNAMPNNESKHKTLMKDIYQQNKFPLISIVICGAVISLCVRLFLTYNQNYNWKLEHNGKIEAIYALDGTVQRCWMAKRWHASSGTLYEDYMLLIAGQTATQNVDDLNYPQRAPEIIGIKDISKCVKTY